MVTLVSYEKTNCCIYKQTFFVGSTLFPYTSEDEYYANDRDCKSYPDYNCSYSQYNSNVVDELTLRNTQIPIQDRRYRQRTSNCSPNINRGFDEIFEIDDPKNFLISPTRNRQEFYKKISMHKNDEEKSNIKYSKSLACTPTNSRLPPNIMNRDEFITYGDRVGRSQYISQRRHRRFNSASNSFRFYKECSTSEMSSQTS